MAGVLELVPLDINLNLVNVDHCECEYRDHDQVAKQRPDAILPELLVRPLLVVDLLTEPGDLHAFVAHFLLFEGVGADGRGCRLRFFLLRQVSLHLLDFLRRRLSARDLLKQTIRGYFLERFLR